MSPRQAGDLALCPRDAGVLGSPGSRGCSLTALRRVPGGRPQAGPGACSTGRPECPRVARCDALAGRAWGRSWGGSRGAPRRTPGTTAGRGAAGAPLSCPHEFTRGPIKGPFSEAASIPGEMPTSGPSSRTSAGVATDDGGRVRRDTV